MAPDGGMYNIIVLLVLLLFLYTNHVLFEYKVVLLVWPLIFCFSAAVVKSWFNCIYGFFDIIFIFKTIHGISGLNFDEFFHFRNKPYKLRGHSLQINANQQYISNNTWKHSFFSRAPKIWNQLPENIVSISSLNRFKHKLKSVDLSKLYKLKYS